MKAQSSEEVSLTADILVRLSELTLVTPDSIPFQFRGCSFLFQLSRGLRFLPVYMATVKLSSRRYSGRRKTVYISIDFHHFQCLAFVKARSGEHMCQEVLLIKKSFVVDLYLPVFHSFRLSLMSSVH